jgi:hypothetical protein
MANPGRTRPASLGPIDPDEPPMPQLFPKIRRELDTSGYGANESDTEYHASVWAIIEDARDYNENYLAPEREAMAQLYDGQLPLVTDEGRSSIVLTEVRTSEGRCRSRSSGVADADGLQSPKKCSQLVEELFRWAQGPR